MPLAGLATLSGSPYGLTPGVMRHLAVVGRRRDRRASATSFNGVGRIVEVPNLPTDPDNVNRDDLVFADGAIHFVNTGLTFSFTINPRTCIGKVTGTQSITVAGGTGRFAHATGSFAGVLAAWAIAPRNVDGTCDVQNVPLLEVDHVSGTGSLSF